MKKIAIAIFIITGVLVIVSFIINSLPLLMLTVIGGVTLGGYFWQSAKPFRDIPLGTPPERAKRAIKKIFDC